VTRGEKNSLGSLAYVPGVERLHRREDGTVVVWFTDGTAFRIRNLTSHQLYEESRRMASRASVLAALARDRVRERNGLV
jgi:hypothetical protein